MPYLSKASIREHNNCTSCWIIIHNNVYDVTRWLRKHPGGADVLLDRGGRDATENFESVDHSCRARRLLDDFKIGSLPLNERTPFTKCDSSCLRPSRKRRKDPREPPLKIKDAECDLTSTMDFDQQSAEHCDLTPLMGSGSEEPAAFNWMWMVIPALLVLALVGFGVKKMNT